MGETTNPSIRVMPIRDAELAERVNELEAAVPRLERKLDDVLSRLSWRNAPWFIALAAVADIIARFIHHGGPQP